MYCKIHSVYFTATCLKCEIEWVPDWAQIVTNREKELEGRLKKFGWHLKGCARNRKPPAGRRSGLIPAAWTQPQPKCDCGWDDISKRIKNAN